MKDANKYLVDTSAWIEFLRKTGSDTNLAVRRMLQDEDDIYLTEPIVMELLAGAGSDTISRVEKLTNAFPLLPVNAAIDYHEAARIYRTVRAAGETVRSQVDCLIAAVAARSDAVLLHHDRDFQLIADLCYLPR